jgi:hypothetical protein
MFFGDGAIDEVEILVHSDSFGCLLVIDGAVARANQIV